MTRPAIVIGLGGTGQWVLTYLKKDLLEIGQGEMPPGVRLLCFDTTLQTTAETGKGNDKSNEKNVNVGAVKLTDGKEFIAVGESVGPLASEISAGKHSHLQWYPAKSYLAKLAPSAFNTAFGAVGIRQMGRITIFRDLADTKGSKILSNLKSAIQGLKNEVTEKRQLEIIIVCSLAGGTGAGMLVDMALLLREQAARLVAGNYVLRGFFVLPRAFMAGGLGDDTSMLARSFAAWRELDRFMIVSEHFGIREMNYHEENTELKVKVAKRAYDISYLIDPARGGENTLDVINSEEGLYPALSQCISAILDDKAGKEYTEFVSTNLDSERSNLPLRPYHSTIGSYSLKVPVYYAREKFSHQLAMDTLQKFLAPEINDKDRVVRVRENMNKEVPEGHLGMQAVLAFMNSSGLNIRGTEIPNTKLPQLIANVRYKEGQKDGSFINQVANGGLTRAQSQWLQALTGIEQDDEGKIIIRDIVDELNLPIWREVPPSRIIGDTPQAAIPRIKNNVPKSRHEHYGMDLVTGERTRGKYGKALEKAKQAQINRFRMLLEAWTLNALNGESTDPLIARTGKLGYVKSFYDALIEVCAYFVTFINKVNLKRTEELRIAVRTKEAAARALAFYERESGKKCWITFWNDFIHPDAHRAQRSYLRAEQMDIDVRKDSLLLDVLSETVQEMQTIAEKGRDEIDRWVAYLATGVTGGNQVKRVEGLYHAAKASLDNVNVNHELDKRLEKVVKLIGEHEYKSDPSFVADALGSIKWQVGIDKGYLNVMCGIETHNDDPESPAKFDPFRIEGENPDQHNLRKLLKLTEKPYRVLHVERPLAKEIKKKYETGVDLAMAVDKMGEPFIAQNPNPTGAKVKACYIRVKSDLDEDTTTYFADFENELKARNPNISGNFFKLVDSEDPHKLTIVRSDDLLPSSDFQMWHACRDAYIQRVWTSHDKIPAGELHIFPAEINACAYEARMPSRLEQDYRALHPEVVALLEDKDRFEMFVLSVALGFLRLENSSGKMIWLYQLPSMKEPIYITYPKHEGSLREEEESIFQVIHNFVIDGIDQRPGLGQQRWIEWADLSKAIRETQIQMGKTSVKKQYQKEINDDNGLVKRITAEVDKQRATVQDLNRRRMVAQEYVDLADLIKLIYLEWSE